MAIGRREFVKLTGAAALCACAGALGISGCSNSAGVALAPEGSYRWDGDRVILALSAVDQLTPVGGAIRFSLAGDRDKGVKVVVVHSAQGTFRAFANRCTHNGKELDYLPEDRKLQCRSGKAQFNLDGDVLRGPAQGALLVYPTHREGNQLVIEVS